MGGGSWGHHLSPALLPHPPQTIRLSCPVRPCARAQGTCWQGVSPLGVRSSVLGPLGKSFLFLDPLFPPFKMESATCSGKAGRSRWGRGREGGGDEAPGAPSMPPTPQQNSISVAWFLNWAQRKSWWEEERAAQ